MSASSIRRSLLSAILLIALSTLSSGAVTKKPTTETTKTPQTVTPSTSEKRPGIIQTNDEKYLSMVHSELLFDRELLRQKLENATIPDVVGSTKVNFGSRLDYVISDIKVIRHEEPKVKVTLLENKMRLEVNVSEISIEGNHSLAWTNGQLGRFESRGHFSLDIIRVSMTCDRRTEILKENNETVRIVSENCQVIVEDVNYDFHDQTSNRYIASVDQKDLRQEIANALKNASNFLTDLNLNFGQNRSQEIYLNMDLLDVFVKDRHLTFHHRGEMLAKGRKSTYKNWPDKIATSSPTSMVQYDISSFPFKTFGEVLHRNRGLNYVFKQSDLPREQKDLLNVNCVNQCFGKLFPSASNKYSGKTVEIDLSTIQIPDVLISQERIQITYYLKVTVYAKVSDYKRDLLFTASVKMTHQVSLNIQSGKISFDFEQIQKPEVKTIESKIGQLKEEHVLMTADLPLMKRFEVLTEMLKLQGIRMSSPRSLRVSHSDWERQTDSVRIRIDYKQKMRKVVDEDEK